MKCETCANRRNDLMGLCFYCRDGSEYRERKQEMNAKEHSETSSMIETLIRVSPEDEATIRADERKNFAEWLNNNEHLFCHCKKGNETDVECVLREWDEAHSKS